MLKINEMENGKLRIEAEADMFVVPNRAGTADGFMESIRENRIEEAKRFCKNNNAEFDPTKDKFIQVWISSEDLNRDNLSSHGFGIHYKNERLYCLNGSKYFMYIPETMLKDLKEGETKTILYKNIELENGNVDLEDANENKIKADLVLNVTAKQRSYRYKNFGNFEDAVSFVLW